MAAVPDRFVVRWDAIGVYLGLACLWSVFVWGALRVLEFLKVV